tara:strand:- start:118 stop:408 length:291 start_codon:yes stop_codon:yes gene_type:complete
MLVERKCLGCGEWISNDICEKCGLDSNPKRVRIQKIRAVQTKKEEQQPPRLELFLQKWKNTKNPFFKSTYWIGYSVWFIYMAILSFFALIVAWGPG